MKKITFLLSTILLVAFHTTFAQQNDVSIKKQAIKAAIGVGGSAPIDDVETFSNGFSAQAEYIYQVNSWLDIRPYAGVIFANTDEKDNEPNEMGFKSDFNAFMIGGKVRLRAPIPWVAPYIEIGAGTSAGEFETITSTINIKENGLLFHIPISAGLQLGPKHNIDLGLTYFVHPGAEQVSGAAVIGVSFPLN